MLKCKRCNSKIVAEDCDQCHMKQICTTNKHFVTWVIVNRLVEKNMREIENMFQYENFPAKRLLCCNHQTNMVKTNNCFTVHICM